jgi:hypothetical protein
LRKFPQKEKKKNTNYAKLTKRTFLGINHIQLKGLLSFMQTLLKLHFNTLVAQVLQLQFCAIMKIIKIAD